MTFEKLHFRYHGESLTEGAPVCYVTTLSDGSMRFRWDETNPRREALTKALSARGRTLVQLEQVHSRDVFEVMRAEELSRKRGDGIITRNPSLAPSVTVADCMPIFLFDTKTRAFGALHSGWRGTGILLEGIRILERYGASPESICAVLGPHIGNCCYRVDEERAAYFRANFGESSARRGAELSRVVPLISELPLGKTRSEPPSPPSASARSWFLSLTNANLFLLDRAGVPRDNIIACDECTCCFKEGGGYKYGSFRRQTAGLPDDMPLSEKQKRFTVQCAFIEAPVAAPGRP